MLCVKGGIIAVGVKSSSQRHCDSATEQVIAATYIMSPLLVIAYAIAGTVTIDFTSEPIGESPLSRSVQSESTDGIVFFSHFEYISKLLNQLVTCWFSGD